MADNDSAQIPDIAAQDTAQDEALTPKFTAADNGATTPDANAPRGDDTPHATTPQTTDENAPEAGEQIKPEFEGAANKTEADATAAKKKKKQQDGHPTRKLKDVEIESGERWIYDENGQIKGRAVFANPQMGIGDIFSKLLNAIALMFSGDEMASNMLDMLYPPEPKHLDYNDIVGTQTEQNYAFDTQRIELERNKKALKSVIEDKAHPDRQLPSSDFVTKFIGGENAIKAIEPQLNRLMDIILTRESNGDPTVIYDYRNKTLPGQGPGVNGYWTGLHPGDKTQRGTVVPDITKMTVNEVIDWQAKYLNEQYSIEGPDGKPIIPRGKGSPAAGAFQFIWGTLKHERDIGHIDGDRIFDWEAQSELAAKRYMLRIENATKGAKTINEVQEKLYEEFGDEWESLQSDEIKQIVKDITREMAQALIPEPTPEPEPPAQVASAPPSLIKT